MEEAGSETGRLRRDQITKCSIYQAMGLHFIFKAMRILGLKLYARAQAVKNRKLSLALLPGVLFFFGGRNLGSF